MKNFKLNNGVEIPVIGFGTWQVTDTNEAIDSVKAALEAGYTHIDTAAIYKNEEAVGIAIKESGIDRSDLFITSKVWNSDRGYDQTIAAFELSLEKLGLDYLDLYLIHWPNPLEFRESWQEMNAQTWRAMEDLYKAGKIKAIGISNFQIHHIESLMQTATVTPMVNQIKICPGITQDELVEYCNEHKILVEAYSPFGTGKIFDNEVMKRMATKYGKSIAQICIKWSMQIGYLPLPKSVTPSRIIENLQVDDFEIDGIDLQIISNLRTDINLTDPDTAEF